MIAENTPNPTENFLSSDLVENSHVLNLDLSPDTSYYMALTPVGFAMNALRGGRASGKRKLVAVASMVGLGLASCGAMQSEGIIMNGSIHDASMKAAMDEFAIDGDILAGTASFEDKADAQLKVKVIADIPFTPMAIKDRALLDYESDLTSTCYGEFQVILPHESIGRKASGDTVTYTVDMAQTYINAYRKGACNLDRDDDAERAQMQFVTVLRDTIVKVTPYDQESISKPDEIMNDIDDNASAALSNKSLEATVDQCGKKPKVMNAILKSVEDGLTHAASATSGLEEDRIKVDVSNPDKIEWHPDKKKIKEISVKGAEFEPKIPEFKFIKKSCDTTKMVTVDRVKQS